MEHVETNCWNCDKEHFYFVRDSNRPSWYGYDDTKFCCSNCAEEYLSQGPTIVNPQFENDSFKVTQRAHREWMYGDNGTYPLPPELMPEVVDAAMRMLEHNEGYDVCNDVDED